MSNESKTLKDFQEIKDLVNGELTVNVEKFVAGNSSAGTRARKALQEIKTKAHALKATIQEEKLGRKN